MNALSAGELKARITRRFLAKGVAIAALSGIAYGLYSAFVTRAMGRGVWADWYSGKAALTPFVVMVVLGVLGSGINDLASAVWAVGIAGIKGKLGDFARCVRTKPGHAIMVCAAVGGPIASAAYIVALQMAGSIVAPIAALCPAIGAIISRFLFRQALNGRMLLGIGLCLSTTVVIGWSSLTGAAGENAVLGCAIALIAALGWAIEGAVAGFSTSVVEYEIGITIRQATSGLLNLLVVFPLMCLLAGNLALAPRLAFAALSSGPAMLVFAVSGFFALFAFSLWYKGNSMCGTALGMAANGAYAFWVPFFCWLVLGVGFGEPGWVLTPVMWVAAVVMVLGILLIAVNPLDYLRRPRPDKAA